MARLYAALLLLLLVGNKILAHQPGAASNPNIGPNQIHLPQQPVWYEENKNQWPSQVRYMAGLKGGTVFLEDNIFTYVIKEDRHGHEDDEKDLKAHAYKVHFDGANASPEITREGTSDFHRNYYIGNQQNKWAAGVKCFSNVQYQNLYEGISLKAYSEGELMKYDFIVQPGANPAMIRMRYEGVDLSVEAENLFVRTSLGNVIEKKPYAYQESGGIKTEIPCSYQVNGNTVSFKINGSYNADLPLVIDPTLIVSTYTGSTADNFGFTATYDAAGNIYIGGRVYSSGYPTVVGSYDLTWNGSYDCGITKFNPTGTALIFSTYYGGSSADQPHSMIVNAANELYVVGRTNSINFPVLGAYDNALDFGYDIFVGKFNSTGGLMASTYIGGDGDDGVNYSTGSFTYGSTKNNYADDGRGEIILDASSNVYVTMCTQSTNFPTTAGAPDNTLGGVQDAVVFKMNSILSGLTWSTYLGGSDYDAGFGIKVATGNVVYVTGGTTSADFPTTAGVLHTTYQGGTADGFITQINATGTSFTRSTFIGTTAYDQSYFLELDNSGAVYITGQTQGAYPVTVGVYNNAGSAQFIHKLNSTLTATGFSTVFGTGSLNPNISPTAFLVDSCQNLYVSGWGRCSYFSMPSSNTTTGLPITGNAYQSTTDGCDFYFIVLTANAQSLWYGTFFGRNGGTPDHVDGGTSRFDRKAVIYQSVCAGCGGSSAFPTTPGAYSTTNGSSNCNNAAIKMDVKVNPLAVASANPPSLAGCAPFNISFFSTGSTASSYQWDFGDGSPLSSSANPAHTYTAAGTYTVTFTATLVNGVCNLIDITTLTVTVGGSSAVTPTTTNALCFGSATGSASVTPTVGLSPYTYVWTPGGQTTSSATGLSAGNYTVTVTDKVGCSGTGVANITQPTQVNGTLTATPRTCNLPNGTATVTASGGTPGYTYSWSAGGQTGTVATGLSAGNHTVTITDSKGCIRTRTVTVGSTAVPTVTATSTAANCGLSAGTATATGSSGVGPYSYSWNPGGQTSQTATGLAPGVYTVTLTDNNSCTATKTVTVAGSSNPTLTATSSSPSGCLVATGSATVTTTGGTPGYTYIWTPGNQTTSVATGLAAGSYSVVVTDVNGCTHNATVAITNTNGPTVASIPDGNATCFGLNNGSLTATPSGGTPGYTYSWMPGSQTSQTATGLGAGSYTVTVSDANGCTYVSTANVLQPTLLTTSVTGTSALCSGGNSGTASASASGGTAGYTYLWSPGLQTTQNITGLASGTYTVLISDANSCTATGTVSITSAPALASSGAQTNLSCFNSNNGSASVTPAGGTPGYTYSWSQGGTSSAITGLSAGSYSVVITDVNGCTSTNTFTLTQPNLLSTSTSQTNINCSSVSSGAASVIATGGTPGYTYSWSNGGSTSAITGVGAGLYLITVTDMNGCTSTNSVNITSTAPVTVSVTGGGSICSGDPITLNANTSGGTPSYTYLWMPGAQTGTSVVVNPVVPTTYTVSVVDANGCSGSGQSNTVMIYPSPVAGFTDTAYGIYFNPYMFTDTSNGSTAWNWIFGDGTTSTQQNPIHQFPGAGTYTVTQVVYNQYGCPDTITHIVTVLEGIIIPNVFTPDDDGMNDVWYVPNSGFDNFHIEIFDRWGLKVFEADADEIRWDGRTSAGKRLTDGTYYYVLRATLISKPENKVYDTKGYITLLTHQR